MRAVLVLFVCVVCWACRPDAHAVTSPNAKTTTSEATDLSPARSAWMSAQGDGSTVAEAQAAARVALIAQLVGDPRWLVLYPLEVHVSGDDVAG
ncbi:MAG: hypothetical protein JKY37_02800, partial [Nannocystaceae bacterium]|nr:hypothetical protein [Nannocystaceae bacterium]